MQVADWKKEKQNELEVSSPSLKDPKRSTQTWSTVFHESDAAGRTQRGAGLGGGNDEREQTFEPTLIEMMVLREMKDTSSLRQTVQMYLILRLLRPGRFDIEKYWLASPDVKGRKQSWKFTLSKCVLAEDADLKLVAQQTQALLVLI